MSYVGLDIDKCVELKAHLDQAAADLHAHANNVAGLLAQAGIQSCQAVAELHDVAAWADYRSRDLQKRIDRARAADSGVAPGARFGGNAKAASEAGVREAEKLKKLLDQPQLDKEAINAELAKINASADDPAFATAFVHRLGSTRLLALLQGIDDHYSPLFNPASIATVARLLATVSKTKPDDSVVKHVLAKASPAQLGTLLKVGGFGSEFTATAAQKILIRYTPMEVASARDIDGGLSGQYRQAAISALKADPAASFLFVRDASQGDAAALRSLLEEPSNTGILTNAFALYKHDAGDRDFKAVRARVIILIGGGVPKMSGGEKQDMAAALRPAFLHGEITSVANRGGVMGVQKDELQNCLAALMSDDKARAMLVANTGDYLAEVIANDTALMAPHRDDRVPLNLNTSGSEIGATFNLMDDAMSAAMHAKVDRQNLEVTAIRAAGHTIGALGVGASGFTGGASTVVGSGVSLTIDRGVDAYSKDRLDSIQRDFDHAPGRDAKDAVMRALVQALKDQPEYRDSFTGNYRRLLDPETGQLVAIDNSNADLFKQWLVDHHWTVPAADPSAPTATQPPPDRLSDLQAGVLTFTTDS